MLRRFFSTSSSLSLLDSLVLLDRVLLYQENLLLRRKLYRIEVERDNVWQRELAGHLAMRFVLAACYPPCSPSRHKICPVVAIAHNVLHAIRAH
jgi:hypothetical protein